MKKHITLVSGLLLATGAFAQVKSALPSATLQPASFSLFNGKTSSANSGTEKADGDLIWSEDFNGDTTWTVGSAVGSQGMFILGNNSHVQVANSTNGLVPYMGAMATTGTTAANGFAFFNGIQYLTPANIAAIQNTWVASPVIDFSAVGSISLSFNQRYRAFNSDVTMVEYSADGGTTWTVSEIVNSTIPTNANATQNTVTVDIPVGNSATGMIRFRWESAAATPNSGYGWMVDDVKIKVGNGDNMKLLFAHNLIGPFGLHYSKFPASQVSAGLNMSFGAEVKNVGYNDQDASIHVVSGSYDETSTPEPVETFVVDSLSILEPDGFPISTTPGVYPLNLTVVADGPLVNTTDDGVTIPFEVTNGIMAIDGFTGTSASIDGSFTSWLNQATGAFTGIGTHFEIFEDGEIGAFEVGIANQTSAQQNIYNGREFFVTLLRLTEAGFDYVDETQTIELAPSHYGHLVRFVLPNPISVEAGEVLVAMACSTVGLPSGGQATGGVPIAMSGVSVAGSTIGAIGANFETDMRSLQSDDATPNIVEVPVVRLDFQSFVGLNELESATDVSIAPNPFVNESNINFTLKADAEVTVTVTDLTGRVVLTVPAAQFAAGNQTIAIDGSAFQSGVYNYTLKVGNNVTTKRVVKK